MFECVHVKCVYASLQVNLCVHAGLCVCVYSVHVCVYMPFVFVCKCGTDTSNWLGQSLDFVVFFCFVK